ncbi:hypothetical protein DCO48_14025 [Pseudomonas sp. SDI]|nr:hypothetical protein DCO48_14025 [Pseudomonas sp. SDI]
MGTKFNKIANVELIKYISAFLCRISFCSRTITVHIICLFGTKLKCGNFQRVAITLHKVSIERITFSIFMYKFHHPWPGTVILYFSASLIIKHPNIVQSLTVNGGIKKTRVGFATPRFIHKPKTAPTPLFGTNKRTAINRRTQFS